MLEEYQIHATLQTLSLLSFIGAVFFARRHKMRTHHKFIYSSIILSTAAVTLMVYVSRGLPSIHGRIGFSIYILTLITAFSGRLFIRGRSSRNSHRFLALATILLFVLMILNGLLTFIF